MNREIIFRGKRIDNGEWVYGYYCPCCFGRFPCRPAIIDKQEMESGCWCPVEVDPETVGQYVGLPDMNGNKIFEGDILKYGELIAVVAWYDLNASFVMVDGMFHDNLFGRNRYAEVIGNIHDNPELLN